MTKYEFMQDMLILARNRHRKELGLCPEQSDPAPTTPEPVKAPQQPPAGFDGTVDNPMLLDSAFPENQHSTYAEDEPVGGEQ